MKIGDKLTHTHYGNITSIATVIGETKTQWKLSDGARLSKKNGRIVGRQGWSSMCYRQATSVDVLNLKKKALIQKLKEFDFGILELDTIVKIDELLHAKE